MSTSRVSRREFLRGIGLTAAGVVVAACSPQTVVVKETVEVEKEKIVKETVEVEKVVTPTSPPSQHNQAPVLADLVAAGSLAPVDERLPADPIVVEPWEEMGQYGGTWREVNLTDDTAYEALHYYEPLVRLAMYTYSPIPNVAEKWESNDEGTVFTFSVRKGLKWSDGAPMTVDDIMFWFNDIANNKELSPVFPGWLLVGGESPQVVKVDDYTVRFTFSQPAARLLMNLGHAWREVFWPKHYLRQFHAEYVDKDTLSAQAKDKGFDDWGKYFGDRNDYNHNEEEPLLFAWTRASSDVGVATYDRNPYYWKVDPEGNQLPYIDHVRVEKAANMEVGQMKCFGGEVDLIPFALGETPQDTMLLKKNEEMGNYTVRLMLNSAPNVGIYAVNQTHKDPVLREIFNDQRFRFALSLAINREDIWNLLYLGQPSDIRQCAPLRYSPYYHEGAAQNYVEHDPDRANELLDEMGLTERDADGYRLRPDGKPIEIVIESRSFLKHYGDGAELAAQHWGDVGIKAMSKPQDTSLFQQRLTASEMDACVDWTGCGFDPIGFARCYIPISDQSVWGPMWGLWYMTNGESGEEPPAEVKRQLELYDQIMVTMSDDGKKELWNEIMEINAENLYHWGICDRAPVPVPLHNRMHNVPTEGFDLRWNLGNIGVTNPSSYFIRE